MTAYGPIIRQIRLEKGFSQKEIYHGIVSKSYAIEFEKGQHEMTVPLFERVLDRILVHYEEFKFIANNYQRTPLQKAMYEFSQTANQNNLEQSKKALKIVTQDNSKKSQIYSALMRLLIHNKENFTIQISQSDHLKQQIQQDQKTISDYLFRLESWTTEELELFINALNFLPYETTKILIASCLKTLNKYKDYQHYKRLATALLINYFDFALERRDFSEIKCYLPILDQLTQDIFFSFERITFIFYQSFLAVLTENKQDELVNCHQAIETMAFLGYAHHQLIFQKILNDYLLS